MEQEHISTWCLSRRRASTMLIETWRTCGFPPNMNYPWTPRWVRKHRSSRLYRHDTRAKPPTFTRWSYLQLATVVFLTMIDISAANPCPSLNIEVPENTPIDTVLFSFETPGAQTVELVNTEFDGYLELWAVGNERYNITLSKSLDLNQLNPAIQPVPNTNEDIHCDNVELIPADFTMLYLDPDLSPIRSIHYSLQCNVLYQGSQVQVTSTIRVAISDVNNNVPYFMCSPYYKSMSELTPVSTTVFTLRGLAADVDPDGGISSFDLVDGGEGHFAIAGAASDGFIVLQKTLDYDDGLREYALNVTVRDIGDPQMSNWAYVYITVLDGDDQNPAFVADLHYLSLPEHNASILNHEHVTDPPLQAYDLDRDINTPIGFSLDSGHIIQGIQYFNINPTSGLVTPLVPLDRQIVSQFIIRVKAYQINDPAIRYSYATLLVSVEDINNEGPVMEQDVYNVSIPENTMSRYRIVQVKALDQDLGLNAELHYYLDDPSGAFDIIQSSGVVYVQDSFLLDREVTQEFEFQVYAAETFTDESYVSDPATVVVTLLDINDNAPSFLPSNQYTFVTNKTATIGSAVGQVLASDPDAGHNGEFEFSILFGTDHADILFAIFPLSGVVFVTGPLDSPYVPYYFLSVEVRDMAQPPEQFRSAVALINITVLPDNVEPPAFSAESFQFSIGEASAVGTTVGLVQASDPDSSTLEYAITEGDPQQQFWIQTYGGWLGVWRELDREYQDVYELTVVVNDGPHSATATVTVQLTDSNDQNPIFDQLSYEFTVTEQQPSGQILGRVQASDLDLDDNALISYSIHSNWVQDVFIIGSTTGSLQTMRSLDREQTAQYEFTVVATDSGNPARSGTARVQVTLLDVNDHAPRFASPWYEASVLEGSAVQEILQVTASDEDDGMNAEIVYTIMSGNASLFAIDQNSGIIRLISAPSGVSIEMLVISASNSRPYTSDTLSDSTVRVTINILDINDNTPIFSQYLYFVTIHEDQAIGSSVIRVLAQDADTSIEYSRITYWLHSDDDVVPQKFMMEPSTGIIYLTQPLDYDPPNRERSLELTVVASDQQVSFGSSLIQNITTQVFVFITDVNDNPPIFSKRSYFASVYENVTVGSTLATVSATDADTGNNGEISFQISSINMPFEVDDATGDIRLTSTLDYDLGIHSYTLEVIAMDNGQQPHTGTTTVEVMLMNVNDMIPQFLQPVYELRVSENQPAGTGIGQVTAVDGDGDEIVYGFAGVNPGLFSISNTTGHIQTTGMLDYEVQPFYQFSVTVTEVSDIMGEPIAQPYASTTTIIVVVTDMNDNAPVFMEDQYSGQVEEGSIPHPILTVSASDSDTGDAGRITYTIASGNQDGVFQIGATSGQLEVVQGQLVEYTRNTEYNLIVKATDAGTPPLNSITEVVIQVIDVNNNAPQFSQEIYEVEIMENAPFGLTVFQVSATDADVNSTLQFLLTPPSPHLTIDANSGIITTAIPLDREDPDLVTGVTVEVSDGQHVMSAEMLLQILDVNDNAPKFSSALFEATVALTDIVGQNVISLIASDADAGHNADLSYWITGAEGMFEINSMTGVITLASNAVESNKETYNLTAYVRDHGEPSLIANTIVAIKISDANIFAPEFSEFFYTVELSEDAAANEVVVALSVIDQDSGNSGQITVTITAGNEDAKFSINDNAEIVLDSTLDYEAKHSYEITVRAADGGETPRTSTAVVMVTVTDVNDNPPVFSAVPTSVNMQGPLEANAIVTQILANDADSDLNGNNAVTYSLTPSSPWFNIGSSTGELRSKTLVTDGSYGVTILARDQGNPSKSSVVDLTINVLTFSEATRYPLFALSLYSVTVEEDLSMSAIILDIDANINNGPYDQGVLYSIITGNTNAYFSMNENTGQLSAIRPLNYTQESRFTLVVEALSQASPAHSSQATVLINVGDINNEPPYFDFDTYFAYVMENAVVGSEVISVQAKDIDSNSVFSYSIVENDASGLFAVSWLANAAHISLERLLDREAMDPAMQGIYTLQLLASDGVHASTTLIKIHVVDISDNPPAFTVQTYMIDITEDANPCEELLQVVATDLDISDQGLLAYGIISGDPSGRFTMDPTRGMLSISCDPTIRLDRESEDSYQLVIGATDPVSQLATTTVEITVTDANDNAPHFLQESYEITITEGWDSMVMTLEFSAIDLDLGANAQIVFSVISPLPNFAVRTVISMTPAVGQLSVTQALDREDPRLVILNGTAQYDVIVVATDRGYPQLSSSVPVTVFVRDINDSPPEFDEDAYEVAVSEGMPLMTTIFTVTATDRDTVGSHNIEYSLLDNYDDDLPFAMESICEAETCFGAVYITGALDAGHKDSYQLQLQATDGVFSSSSAILVVNIVDINNHSPTFTQSLYTFHIAENDLTAQTGQPVGRVMATDGDSRENGRISYFLTSRSDLALFHIPEEDIGNITVAGVLDREAQRSHVIIVTAVDHGSPSRMSTCEVEIIIDDVNDNHPQFVGIPYEGRVIENAVAGTMVFVYPGVHASDADTGIRADVVYKLTGTHADWFDLDPALGLLEVNEEGTMALDREIMPFLELEIMALDQFGAAGNLNTTTILRITLEDVNDNRPQLSQDLYEFSVVENVPYGTWVGVVVATDADAPPNNELLYTVVDGDSGMFFIDASSGTLYTSGNLDRESKSVYMLNISVSDLGSDPHRLTMYGQVIITITDENDNVPVFDSTTLIQHVSENQPPGDFIGVVVANDIDEEDSYLQYFIDSDAVAIDLYTGALQTILSLDREQQPEYYILVTVTDSFIDPLTSTATLTLVVTDVNDNAPAFGQESYHTSILNHSPIGTVVLVPHVDDIDQGVNGHITFALSSNEPAASYFGIDVSSGVVQVEQEVSISDLVNDGVLNPGDSEVTLTIIATDGGDPRQLKEALLQITLLDPSDDSPHFQENSYMAAVMENAAAGTEVVQVSAVSSDITSVITYSMLDPGVFNIDPQTGTVTTLIALDRETQAFYSYSIQARDNKSPPNFVFTVVVIEVMDQNDNSPAFHRSSYSFDLPEETYNSMHHIGDVQATDEDAGANAMLDYEIIAGNSDDMFSIDGAGALRVSGQVDRELVSIYHLIIKVSDSGSPPLTSTTDVIVNVLDNNDNSPTFDDTEYEVSIPENGPILQEVIAVFALDADAGLHGTVVYTLESSMTEDHPFYLQNQENLAIIYTTSRLDFESRPLYTLRVIASDLGSPSLSSSIDILINVVNLPDESPVFSQDVYEILVEEAFPIDSVLYTLSAGPGEYMYHILGGNVGQTFQVDNSTGDIILKSELNKNQHSMFELVVMATNMAPDPETDMARVLIIITESSPAPEFPQSSYQASLPENMDPPQLVIDLTTYDEMSGIDLRYFIKSGNIGGVFDITPATGELWCIRELDRESRSSYDITIGCERVLSVNTGESTRRKRSVAPVSEVTVQFSVGDINDNPPRFLLDPVVVGVSPSANFLQPITILQVYDADQTNTSSLVFYFEEDSTSRYFYIDSHGGLFPTVDLSNTGVDEFVFKVNVSDDWGEGYTSQTTVKVFVLSEAYRVILIADIPPAMFLQEISPLVDGLSEILRWQVRVESILPHVPDVNDNRLVDTTRTDIYFYCVDMETESLVPKDEVVERISENEREIEALFARYSIIEVRPVASRSSQYDISIAEAALIVIAVIILLGALIGIVILLWSRHKKHRELNHRKTSPMYANMKGQHLGAPMTNPLFMEPGGAPYILPLGAYDNKGHTIDDDPSPGPSSKSSNEPPTPPPQPRVNGHYGTHGRPPRIIHIMDGVSIVEGSSSDPDVNTMVKRLGQVDEIEVDYNESHAVSDYRHDLVLLDQRGRRVPEATTSC